MRMLLHDMHYTAVHLVEPAPGIKLYAIAAYRLFHSHAQVLTAFYCCSPRRVSRKLWNVYETVSCMQQLRERYASRTCYYARASFNMTPVPGIKLYAIAAYRLFHSHAQVLTFTDSTRWTRVYL